MQPRKINKKSINPRELTRLDLRTLLIEYGYVPQELVLTDLMEMLSTQLPLLIEGQRGAGKTALAEYLAESCNLNLFYFQCMEGLSLGDLLYEWEKESQNQFVEQAVKSGMSLHEARKLTWTIDFLKLGEVLSAFVENTTDGLPNILVIDEVDKLPEANEDMLLQVLARFHAHIPRLQPDSKIGLPENQSSPIIFLTSNNMRSGISAPMRSRFLFTEVHSPTPKEELEILTAQVKGANPNLRMQIVRMMVNIRLLPNISPDNKPALREAINLLKSLTKKKIESLSCSVFENHICHLAKTGKDRHSLLASKEQVVKFALGSSEIIKT
ncbi:MAG TPA: MoxR family ATPase [Pyrinomonadaceae bacterium]|nr:MoxR family ATPase [Pyrinomonadaceae bacterium]